MVGVALGAAATAGAQVSTDEALAQVYRGATAVPERLFLTEAQIQRAAARSHVSIDAGMVLRYRVTRNGADVGRAYVDTLTVRTKKASILVSLDVNGDVVRVDITAFLEPREYRPPTAFLGQFDRRSLDDDLQLHRGIRPIAGATLTARAVVTAVRRMLAIDWVLTHDVTGDGRDRGR